MSFFKGIWKNKSRHQKLSEEMALHILSEKEKKKPFAETDKDATVFKVKYLGSTCIEKSIFNQAAQESVKSMLKEIKSSKRKFQRVILSISINGVEIKDTSGQEIFKISIYNISNCSTHTEHRCVFSFVSIDEFETTSCHAFMTSKRKIAESATLTVALLFSKAYEVWRIQPQTKEFLEDARRRENRVSESSSSCIEEKLIDFDVICEAGKTRLNSTGSDWVSFEEDSEDDELNDTNNVYLF